MLNFQKYQSVENIIIPDNIIYINNNFSNKFKNLYHLTTLEMPTKDIINASYMCYNCDSLSSAPLLGEKCTNMAYAFYNTSLFNSSYWIGDNVINASYAYFYTHPRFSNYSCGNNVEDFSWTYAKTSSDSNDRKYVCGPNVINMCGTYSNTYLQADAVCGPRVKDMSIAYYNCYNLSNCICGLNVINMSYAYYNAKLDNKSAVCGPNVVNMSGAYCNTNIIEAACGPKVEDMSNAYRSCDSINNFVCGPNVINMSYTYAYLHHTSNKEPVCGPKVEDMSYAYFNCDNLMGSAACGPNVVNMAYAYHKDSSSWQQNKSYLQFSACGSKVENMSHAYYDCESLVTAECGPNVINMSNAYYNCRNIIVGDCGPNVVNMSGAYYDCDSLKYLKNCPICNNTTDLSYAFYNCQNLKCVPQFTGPITNLVSAFYNCYNLTGNVPVTNHDYISSYSSSFENCSYLTGTAIIGNNATSALRAYANCSNISKMIVGKNITNLCDTYYGCTRMTNLYVHSHNVNDIANAPHGCYLNIYVPKNSETFNTFKNKIVTSNLNISGSNSILTLWNNYTFIRLFGVNNVAETLSYRDNYKNNAIVIYSNNTMGIYTTLPSDLSNAIAIHTDCFNLPSVYRTPWKTDATNVTDIIISNDVTLNNLDYWFAYTNINNVANIPMNWNTVSSIYETFAYCDNLTDAW